MTTHLRFVSRFSLSANNLDYILLPEEAARKLQRIKKTATLHALLPSGLRMNMAIYARRNPMEYIGHLMKELARGDYVALSMTPRPKALSESELKKFPFLAQRVRDLQDQPQVFRKAGYKTVTDFSSLARQPVYVPVEPTPEHKIVVEFAGQWSGNPAGLRLDKTDSQHVSTTKPRADRQASHRSVAVFKGLENVSRKLFLTVPLNGQVNPLKLLLAENVTPVDKQTEQEEWDNVLVPVRPLAYLNGEKDMSQAAELKGGYLYVFWKNKLWRELKVNDKGYYQDIDVEYYRHRNTTEKSATQPVVEYREAEGFPLSQFWVPYKINGEVQQGEDGIKLMFSPTQRPYSKVESLEADTSKLDACATSLDEMSVYSDSQTFSVQANIADIPNAQIHTVSADDMPWLTDTSIVMRSLDDSNTIAAYVDGHNHGFMLMVEVGLDDEITGETPELFAVMEDANSEWQQTVVLEAVTECSDSHYRQALLSGLPTDGVFTLYIISPRDPDSMEVVFADISYQDIMAERAVLESVVDTGNALEPDEDAEQQSRLQQDLMTMWQDEILAL